MPADTLLKNMSLGPEAELLLHCARLNLDPERAERVRALAQSNFNWTKLYALAQRHALIPLLFFQLNRLAAEVPPAQLKQLRDRFQSNSALNVILTAEMVSLLKLFESQEIPALPYKGPAIGVGIYGNSALRQFVDLDILVPETAVWKATELLIERGYEAHFTIPARKQSSFIRLSYVRLFKHESKRITVELHWRLAPRFFGASFDTARLWQSNRRIKMQGAAVRVPEPDDLILMLCIHGAKDCWAKLEWVCSLAELVRAESEVDWDRLLDYAKEIGCLTTVVLGLRLANELLDAPVPPAVLSRPGPQRKLDALVSGIIARFFSDDAGSLSLPERIKFHLQVKDTQLDKLRYCVRLALTTTPVDWELVYLPEAVSFLYLPLRVLRLLGKYGSGNGQLATKSGAI